MVITSKQVTQLFAYEDEEAKRILRNLKKVEIKNEYKLIDNGIKEYINSDSTAKANNGGDDTVAAVSAMGYDAYFVALEALKAAGSTEPAKVMEALWNVTYTGVTGEIAFEQENGDAIRDTAYVKVANTETGAWDFVAEQGVE